MAKWNIDKLCRPKKYMGQIMAECDCQFQLCEDRGYCMADTPSPEAIVKAALERAADKVSDMMYLLSLGKPEEGPFTKQDRTCKETREQASEAIRSLASDPAEVAAIIKAAGEDRG